jgi:hypothetical protein
MAVAIFHRPGVEDPSRQRRARAEAGPQSATTEGGLPPARSRHRKRGFPVFKVSPGAKPVTPEMVRRTLEEIP